MNSAAIAHEIEEEIARLKAAIEVLNFAEDQPRPRKPVYVAPSVTAYPFRRKTSSKKEE